MAEVAVAETEMAAALMAAYDALVEKVKARRPIGSDKKPTELGFVYSQLIQGLLVDPRDDAAIAAACLRWPNWANSSPGG